MATANTVLFQPFQLGDIQLQHRIVMAPMTRMRCNTLGEPGELAVEYYSQRASTPGTLIIAEGSIIAAQASGYPFISGLWSNAQVAGWKKVVDAVHSRGCFIFAQIAALGRSSSVEGLAALDPGYPYVSAGNVPLDGASQSPRPLTKDEIREYTQLFAIAARNAVEHAGFDGVEIHGAHGYLVDQFIQTNTNNRGDEYGGAITNRIRFPLEVIDAVVKAVGEKRCGIRISPWSRYQNMRMHDPIPTFKELVTQIRDKYPEFAYLHVVEPRIAADHDQDIQAGDVESNDGLRQVWGQRPFISAGGHDLDSAILTSTDKGGLVAFGRSFIANPDLVARLRHRSFLNKYDRSSFYTPGSKNGYIDYPFMAELDAQV